MRVFFAALFLILCTPAFAAPHSNNGHHYGQHKHVVYQPVPGPQGPAGPAGESIQGPQGPASESIKGDPGVDGKNAENVSNNAFDYGVAGDVVLFETPNTEWGARSTYAYEGNETRVYAYGKIYLNRMTYQKK